MIDDQADVRHPSDLPFDDNLWDAVASAFERHTGRRAAIAANGVGFVLVAVQLAVLSIPWTGGHAHFRHDAIVVSTFGLVYFAVAVLIGVHRGERRADRAFGWVRQRRAPTVQERSLTLGFPSAEAIDEFGGWFLGAILIAVVHAVLQYPVLYTARVGIIIALGGLTSGALSYLLLERVARPVLRVVLAGEAPPAGAVLGLRGRLILSWLLSGAVPVVLLGTAALGLTAAERAWLPVSLAVLAGLSVVAGLAFTAAMAWSLVEPVVGLQAAQRRVQNGDLTAQIPVDYGGEVGQLQAGFNHMVEGMRERERLHDLFGRHVGTEVARFAMTGGVRVGGERRPASVLFVDLIGSTSLAQRLPPESMVTMLNDMFAAVVQCVGAEGGWVNKFEGDAALCVFGPPDNTIGHAAAVLRAARSLRTELAALAERYPELDAAIGISTGIVVAGNIGAERRYEYTVIGDPVNVAARLTEKAKTVPERILVAHDTIADAPDEARWWQPHDTLMLRGRSTPTKTFAPLPVDDTAAARA
ncbi:adenylate/guanylate cyclase domain-containing protein [Nocardia colli]|uniref:Adenylate/guanylate cyclase domain-containing protein n=1 Tax=Nocardia colli TaxID=2545717 RepID=A0A5N0EDL2_9NOCA|nr:adenylate/guanylate cyclase domain-containing protein [Nocardia colli]KAA8885521.1 adenylate/guanylate cyclase domain-containing protein [Nocardia colli]